MVNAGIGWDSHRLVEGRPLILGGVEIPSDRGLEGHSDADVLTHAVIDALLGAAAHGDIGERFPDTDDRWKDADSLELLRLVVEEILHEGYTIHNVDATVVLEEPKLAPWKPDIRTKLARVLRIGLDQINVKASTAEKMGFVGRGEGIVALAVVAVEDRSGERP